LADSRGRGTRRTTAFVARWRRSGGRRGSDLRLSVTVRRRFLYVAIPSASAPGWVTRVAMPIDQFTHHVRAETRVLVLGTVVTTLLAIGLSAVAAWRLTRPLRHAGDLSVRRGDSASVSIREATTRSASWRAA
jgi:hypothetical protein